MFFASSDGNLLLCLAEFYGTGPMITCINDLKILLMRIVSVEDTTHEKLSGDKKLLLSLMEPTIEYIMNMIFKSSYQVSDKLTFCSHTSCLVHFCNDDVSPRAFIIYCIRLELGAYVYLR